jgi:hypothetical protein
MNGSNIVLAIATLQSKLFHRIYSNINKISRICTLVGYMDLANTVTQITVSQVIHSNLFEL